MSDLIQLTGGDRLTVVITHKRTGEYFIPSVLDGLEWEIRTARERRGKLILKLLLMMR